VELTSGNTGIGLAIVSAVKGFRFHAVMSAGNSIERRRMLTALGAEVVLVPQASGSRPGEVSGEDLRLVEEAAEALASELGAWRPDQFANPSNALSHEETTAVEIWEQTGGCLHVWVASVGTAGTFVGTARGLKRRNSRLRCIAAEPASARRLAGLPVENPAHKIQGTGYSMVPPQWDPALCDGYLGVTDEDAIATTRLLATREGIFAGFSSGANVWAALQLARDCEPGTIIVTVCPDTGLKYLSTDLFPE
jgi:cysteine synthase